MRIDYASVEPVLISRFRQLTREVEATAIDATLRVLVELRVSQINGCAYCIHIHTAEACKLGESRERLNRLSDWKEAPGYTSRERAALAWAEALTVTGQMHHDEEAFVNLTAEFPEEQVVALGLIISLANFWNRMAGGFRREFPGHG